MFKREYCKTCGQKLEIVRIPSIEGQDGEHSVRLLSFPVLTCPANHERWYVYDDFGPDLLESIYDTNKAYFTERKGFFRRRDYCARCHHVFEKLEESRQTVEIPIHMKNGHDFTLEVSGPALTCTVCHSKQIHNVEYRTTVITEALANAMQASAIHPR